MTTKHLWQSCVIAAVMAGCVLVGCKSDKNPTPTPGTDASISDSGSIAGSGGTSGGGSGGGGGKSGSGGSGGSSGSGEMDAGDDTGTPLPSCTDSTLMCFKCDAKTQEQFLDHCASYSAFTCTPFDNSTLGLGTSLTLPTPIP